ncbi:hypothetical protein K432DRAFT_32564 [Lepidopterella palustris CBS 459.81]|uniref:Secreted protein n=1 Tax=Lepidopterella palustris CBS 459.81 TaxID=1314670 RepID=A0A8E2EBA7_9PEZI|nr:hypothetical protein K432DRAFT_32564 [Lepidopterella palustris CBS 459.81]
MLSRKHLCLACGIVLVNLSGQTSDAAHLDNTLPRPCCSVSGLFRFGHFSPSSTTIAIQAILPPSFCRFPQQLATVT